MGYNVHLDVTIGKKYGKWEVIDSVEGSKCGEVLCKCECGKTKPISRSNLAKGKSSKCVECQGKEYRKEPKVGEIFGNWELIESVDYSIKPIKMKCKCKCGLIKKLGLSSVMGGYSKGCGKCNLGTPLNSVHSTMWKSIVNAANSRDRQVNITWEQALEKLEKQEYKCALSGIKLIIAPNNKAHRTDTTASLDRINSNIDYEITNIQWVHKHINRMKCNYPEDYFIDICKLIAEHQSNKQIVENIKGILTVY